MAESEREYKPFGIIFLQQTQEHLPFVTDNLHMAMFTPNARNVVMVMDATSIRAIESGRYQ
jgi:hypothetical protein